MSNNVATGRRVEAEVATYLQRQGLIYVTHNYYTRFGEIDLIFREKLTWIFIEVKFRNHKQFGRAEDAFTKQKRQRLTKSITIFMAQYGLNPYQVDHRIDLFAINGTRASWYKAV